MGVGRDTFFTRRAPAAVAAALSLAAPPAFAADAAAPTAVSETQPLREDACYGLRGALEKALDLTPAFLTTPQADAPYGAFGITRACRLQLNMTAILFETADRTGFEAAVDAMRAAMTAAGWGPSDATRTIAADGPMGTVFGLAKGQAICVVEVSLTLPEDTPRDPETNAPRLMAVSPADRRYRLSAACVEDLAE